MGPPDDHGQLWENFVLAERQKYLSYAQKRVNRYFWRVYTGGELDYIEEEGGQLRGYELKYTQSKAKAPKTWLETYKEKCSYEVINRENYLDFLLLD